MVPLKKGIDGPVFSMPPSFFVFLFAKFKSALGPRNPSKTLVRFIMARAPTLKV